MKKFLLLFLISLNVAAFGQFESPKHELRGVWIASLGIDWPTTTGTSAAVISSQKSQLISIFDTDKDIGLNAVFFHVRPVCDAIYKSSYEPWSAYLTGTQGVAPSDPNYDPLEFAIQEAHKRGMELHAWLNPYRAELQNGSQVSANNVINEHPDWIIKCSSSQYRFLNPGLPEVRQYVLRIVMDIVERYDVDGIHFDDYFYPYSDYGSFNDDATFAKYSNGFTDKAAWRKNNVDLLLKMIADSINAVKPWIKFGVSPSGNPSVNNSIYVDPAAWLAGNYTDTTGTAMQGDPYIDYIMPQLYWESYGGYQGVWTSPSFLNGRHTYIGQAAYRYTQFAKGECAWEINTNRNTATIEGGVFFSSRSLIYNYGKCLDTLKYHYFAHPALTPKMDWKSGGGAPNAPANLRFEVNSSSGKYELHWDKPAATAGGDTAFVYMVYRSENNPPDVQNPANIFGKTGETYLSSDDAKYSVTKGNYYIVTAVDRYSNESVVSNAATLDLASLIPSKPVLNSPADDSHDLSMSTTLKWTGDSNTERYIAEVSEDSTFNSNIVLLVGEYRNSQVSFSGVVPGKEYYWRVKAFGQVGESGYSDVYSFKSGIPLPPVLYDPAHATTGVSLTPQFTWSSSEDATKYRIQVSTSVQFHDGTFVIDTTLADTIYTSSIALTPNKIYYWRTNAQNQYGTSYWTSGFGFKTTPTTDVISKSVPTLFALYQNYPNPFNPSTRISFELPVSGYASLKVYDVLGREVAELIDGFIPAGFHSISFDGSKLSSGMYIYTLKSGGNMTNRKMILTK